MVSESQMSGTQLLARRALPDEWRVYRRLRLAALTDAPDAFGSTLSRELAFDEAEWRRRLAAWPVFVAWRESEPVGLAAAIAESGPEGTAGPAPDPAGPPLRWQLVSMWVSPQARGSGAADKLAAAVIEHVRAAGADRLTLWVADGNDRARAFCLRLGFRPTGERHRHQRHGGPAFDEEKLALDFGPAR